MSSDCRARRGPPELAGPRDSLSKGARRFAAAAVAAVLLYLFQWLANEDQTMSLDVVIYGATPSGIAAALAVMDTWGNARVAILEPTNSIGGMATQGIGLRDFKYVELMRSTMREWGILNAQFYNVTYPVWQPDNFVGEASFKTLLGSRGIQVHLNTRLEQKFSAIRKTPHNRRLIAAVKTYCQDSSQSRWWTAKYFVDASYEGDLLRFSGASYTLGREANSTYNESRAGVTMSSLGDFDVDVDPIGVNDELLPFVNGFGPSGDLGSSDKGLMGYSMRVCVTTNLQKRVPFSRPPEYSARTYELLARYYRAGGKATPYLAYPYVSYPERDKFDVCDNGQRAPISTDAAGWGVEYPLGSYAERVRIAQKHQEYVAGMFWFLQTDPSVPKKIQVRTKQLGLCKDEWLESDHWPSLYVREGLRLVSDNVFAQHDCDAGSQPLVAAKTRERWPERASERFTRRLSQRSIGAKPYNIPCRDDNIGIGGWGYDVHIIRRYAEKIPNAGSRMKYRTRNEGQTDAWGGAGFFELPRSLIEPKHDELSNLLVTTCAAASHVVFSAVREEPTLWQLGQAAGTIIAHALQLSNHAEEVAVGDVPTALLQRSLLRQGSVIHWPRRDNCSSTSA